MKFIAEPTQLTIYMEGMEKFWALKSRLQIPYFAIESIDYNADLPVIEDRWSFFRFPGSAWPGLFAAGTFLRRGERDFWYVHMRQPGLLSLKFKPDTLNYDRALLSCTPDIAQNIMDWWEAKVH